MFPRRAPAGVAADVGTAVRHHDHGPAGLGRADRGIGDLTDMTVILAVIAVNSALGIVQEVRAGRAISALTALTAPTARVYGRGRTTRSAPAKCRRRPAPPGRGGHHPGRLAGSCRREPRARRVRAWTGSPCPCRSPPTTVQPAGHVVGGPRRHAAGGTVVTRAAATRWSPQPARGSALGGIARMLAEHQPPATPLTAHSRPVGRQLPRSSRRCLSAGRASGAGARRAAGAMAVTGGQPRGRGGTGVAAGRRDAGAGAGRPPDGRPRHALVRSCPRWRRSARSP